MPEQLRKLAKLLKDQAEKNAADKEVKCAQYLVASMGLDVLRQKLGL